VTDVISVGGFAVFNIADACISVGTVLLIFAVWNNERKQKKLAELNQEATNNSTETSDSEQSTLE
jgi:lipoprotein signal peptidase